MSNIKWQYADHWKTWSPRGPINQFASIKEMDRFIKQIVAVGFRGIGMFVWNLPMVASMFGSVKTYKEFIGERGIEQIVDIFWAAPYETPGIAPHRRETHGIILSSLERFVQAADGIGVENLVVMPTNTHFHMEPITDDKIRATAELWNRVGEMSRRYGIKLGCHHEFWGGVRTWDQITKFYEWTDPEHVHLYLDTAQHQIAGVDPVELYLRYHDRVSGFHFKDTHHVDLAGDYRRKPDAELLASTTPRWFHEMGTPEGLVDFPLLMRALKEHQYQGWIGVEHDKAEIGGGSYAESTAVAMWYAKNVLEEIYQ
jgi:inosose dehydratase